MAAFQDAFISYGRADSKAFAIKLKDRLAQAGYRVWFDFDDIPLATDFQDRIDAGIEMSHNFLYVISPSSVNSVYCDKELHLAIRSGKRIIPLMHVEEISRETWQARNPDGTEADWEAFQAAGKHRSFENLHEAPRKLNWVWFREGRDDFEQSLAGLLALFPLHQNYVQRHTQLLTEALVWERHHKQTRYLLVGVERQGAEAWLQQTFEREAVPCEPTPLHCEFITESIKNANNLMTQVFLCHAEEDREAAERVRLALMRRGMTVWNYRTDIQGSRDYQAAIAQGVEEADNFIFILSPHSAQSDYCGKELAKAEALNKRVIPILVTPMDEEQIPESLRDMQHLDLSQIQNEPGIGEQASTGLSELLKLLNEEAAYYDEHKTWLTQALKWQRQQQNPTMLLRGYNLNRAEAWLKLARSHRHGPNELQEQFVEESLRQPPSESLDVFVSYSRVDSDFARKLNEALQIQGKSTWFDQESIATGTDFQQEIHRGIESSDVFLFVLSPESVQSPYCADEVEYAHGLNKRMVTVLHRPIDTADLHPVLGKIQWLDFREHGGEFQPNFQSLLRVLDTDREHLEVHTRLLLQAVSWDRRGRSESLLLRDEELETAEAWLENQGEIEPKPTGLQGEYVRAGRARQEAQEAAERKLKRGMRMGLGAAVAGGAVAIGIFTFANIKLREADIKLRDADTRLKEANQLLEVAQAGLLLEQAGAQSLNQQKTEPLKSLLRAIKATRELEDIAAQYRFEVLSDYPAMSPILALQQIQAGAALSPHLLAHKTSVLSANFSPDGNRILTASEDGTAHIWNIETGKSLLLEGHKFKARGGGGVNANFSPDGNRVLTFDPTGTARIWNVETGESQLLEGHEIVWGGGVSASFSPDGNRVLTFSRDGNVRIWNVKPGESKLFEGYEANASSASFSPDSNRVLTGFTDGTVRIWDVETGQSQVLEGHEVMISATSFSSDGTKVLTASEDGTARIWNVETGKSKVLKGHAAMISSASFSPDGTKVITASTDETARIWDVETGKSKVLEGHEAMISSASFSPDGTKVITASADGPVRIWDVETGKSQVLEGHGASFSPTGNKVLTVSNRTAHIWDVETGKSKLLEGHTAQIWNARFSPDGTKVITASYDGTARIWNVEMEQSQLFEGYEADASSASFSPDGNRVITASDDGTARIWDIETGKSQVLEGHGARVESTSFSHDGKRLLTASADTTVRIWDIETGKSQVLEGHRSRILSANFSPDDSRVLMVAQDGTARIWDIETGKSQILEGYGARGENTSFSPDGNRVLTVTQDGTAQLWNVETGRAQVLEGHESRIMSASFSLDGHRVLTTSADKNARIWNVETGKSQVFEGHESFPRIASFSPDGNRVLTVTTDVKTRIWNVETGKSLLLEGHEAWVESATFSSDSQRVVTDSHDGTVRIWDMRGRPLAIFEGSLISLSSDGRKVLLEKDDQLQIYNVETPAELIAWGCQWLDNYLKYGRATDADRAICDLPPRPKTPEDKTPAAPAKN